MTIVNGVPSYYHSYDDVERVIKLPNLEIEFRKTDCDGLKEICCSYSTPIGGEGSGGGAGMKLVDLLKTNSRSWISEQMLRRIMELEDELHILKSAIAYKGKNESD